MAGRMRTSQAGVDLITRFEGFRPRSEALDEGGYVIGFGHTRHAKANQKITQSDALTLLTGHDLPPIEKAIAARALAPLGQNEFDALVSFAFNIGLENFFDSDVFALVNSGAKLNAAEAMAAWRKARVDGRVIVVDALVRRRAAERALFLEVEGGPTPAATPVIRPILDLATAILHPRDPSEGMAGAGDDADDTDTEPTDEARDPGAGKESTPEAAARRVTERLTRILGEAPGASAPQAEPSEESVAEITRAVSALADPIDDDALPAATDAGDAARPQSSGAQYRGGCDAPLSQDEGPAFGEGAATLVDDLEPAHIGRAGPETDLADAVPAPWGALLLYGLSAFGGALIGAWGLNHLGETAASQTPLSSDWALYVGPFALLLGALIFLIMGYYFLRALFSDG